jgi:hypothetical protein
MDNAEIRNRDLAGVQRVRRNDFQLQRRSEAIMRERRGS